MKKTTKAGPSVFFLVLAAMQMNASVLMDIEGDYLLYSFDLNYISGRGSVIIRTGDCEFRGSSVEVDVRNRELMLSTDCTVTCRGSEKRSADRVRMDLSGSSVTLYLFREKMEVVPLKGQASGRSFAGRGKTELEDSLLYFIGTRFRIRNNFEITGYDVTVFLEGVQSVSLKRFRMDKGIRGGNENFNLNNLWYTNKSGLITDISFSLNKNLKNTAFSNREFIKLNYDIFSVRQDSPKAEFNVGTESSLKFPGGSSIRLKGGYITGNSGQAMFAFDLKPAAGIASSITLDYRDRVAGGRELWVRGGLGLDLNRSGRLNLKYNHEKNLGYSGDLEYSNTLGKHFSLNLFSNISGARSAGVLLSRISDTRLSLQYTNSVFDLSTYYSLNRDLIYENSRHSPGFVLNTRPVPFYGGLLNLNFSTALVFSSIRRAGGDAEDSFRSNSSVSISGKELRISPEMFVDISGKIEQFLESDNTGNTTAAGIIIRGVRSFSKDLLMELIYNFHTRRETGNGMIAGTSSGDISGLLKFGGPGRDLNLSGSVSYDTESGDFTTGFFNLRYNLVRNWSLNSFFNYDFEFNVLNCIFFLERFAGRILLRASYRSLSKQFQLEIIPR